MVNNIIDKDTKILIKILNITKILQQYDIFVEKLIPHLKVLNYSFSYGKMKT